MVEIRPLERSSEALEEVARLLQMAFPRARHVNAAYLGWNYLRNPDGLAFAYNAYAGGRLVSHFAVTPMRALVDGREERGLQMQHAATDPEHQGKGLFKELAERCFQAGAEAGHGFAVAPANALSTIGFVRRLGFQMVRPFEVRIGVGPRPRGDPQVKVQFKRLWGCESLTWRLSRPDLPYRLLRRGDEAVVFASSGLLGMQVELGTYPAAQIGRSLPDLGLRNPIHVWIGLDPSRSWLGRAYLNLPLRLRPAPLNFVFRDLSGRGRLLDGSLVRADMLDYDAY